MALRAKLHAWAELTQTLGAQVIHTGEETGNEAIKDVGFQMKRVAVQTYIVFPQGVKPSDYQHYEKEFATLSDEITHLQFKDTDQPTPDQSPDETPPSDDDSKGPGLLSWALPWLSNGE